MFQILMLLSTYYSSYVLSNTIYNIKKNLNQRICILNFHNIKNIDISDKFINFNFDPILILNHKTDVYIHIEKLYTR